MSLYHQYQLITSGKIELGKRIPKPNVFHDWEICVLLSAQTKKLIGPTSIGCKISKKTLNLVKAKVIKSLFKKAKVTIF